MNFVPSPNLTNTQTVIAMRNYEASKPYLRDGWTVEEPDKPGYWLYVPWWLNICEVPYCYHLTWCKEGKYCTYTNNCNGTHLVDSETARQEAESWGPDPKNLVSSWMGYWKFLDIPKFIALI